ncbi:MAG: N-acetyltransferase [Alphaproteobacteria bacterium]|nr:N-acetyltransferase [Alphaproteobacteria bacterium]
MTPPPYALRPPAAADIVPYYYFLADPEVAVWLEDACQRPVSTAAVEDFVLRRGWCHWAIDAAGGFAGLAGIDDPDLVRGQARFFIIIGRRDLWGQGLGTAVTRQVLDYGFAVLGLRKVISDYLEPNFASARVHANAGFTVEGRLRADAFRRGSWVDRILVSVLRDEFMAGRP